LSTIGAGYLADRFGTATAFAGLAATAVFAFVLLLAMMPETKPAPE
jgi:predicted MFS family arabinose efflux permease